MKIWKITSMKKAAKRVTIDETVSTNIEKTRSTLLNLMSYKKGLKLDILDARKAYSQVEDAPTSLLSQMDSKVRVRISDIRGRILNNNGNKEGELILENVNEPYARTLYRYIENQTNLNKQNIFQRIYKHIQKLF